MKTPDLYIQGQRLDLLKRIGKGGEGDVFLTGGDVKHAVKVYKEEKRKEREQKVKAMVREGLSTHNNLVAYPAAVVTTRSGAFTGFVMRLVDGFRPIHELYGPKSRKIHYPTADYRFLLRVAVNVARAVGEVHSSTCIIGDLNHSGILVSSEATVALIDADSFQFQSDGRTYPCLVGVPEFTPPELQGVSLQGVLRTKDHDNFGLAITIFQLLFMGRHPYGGQQATGGDLTLDKLIARDQFAYSRKRSVDVSPPGIVATLNDFPSDIADAFERAFGLDPSQRPSAIEWIALLKAMEGRLSRCAVDGIHYYPSAAKRCPWCRMEQATGAVLFLPLIVANAARAVGLGNFDVERAWLAINAVTLPDPKTVLPKLSASGVNPSAEAISAKFGGIKNKLVGTMIAVAAVVMFFVAPSAFLLWIVALMFAAARFNGSGIDASAWRDRFIENDRMWEERLQDWRTELGISNLVRQKNDLEAAVNEYRGLASAKTQAIARLKSERVERQRKEFLDRCLIRGTAIAGIGQSKIMILASFGIESAADVTSAAVMRIPGFGPATAGKLLAWRALHERRFVYNASPLPSDVQAQTKIETDYAAKAVGLANLIAGGQVELVQAATGLKTKIAIEDGRLTAIAAQKSQLVTDFKFLGLSVPSKSAINQPAPYTKPTSLPVGSFRVGSVACPLCGASMVLRTARRGRRRGKQFWGCSRFPSCMGSRS